MTPAVRHACQMLHTLMMMALVMQADCFGTLPPSYSNVGEFDSSHVTRLSCHSTTPGTSRNSPLLIVSDTNIATSGDTTHPFDDGNVYSTRTTRCSELECDHSTHSSMSRCRVSVQLFLLLFRNFDGIRLFVHLFLLLFRYCVCTVSRNRRTLALFLGNRENTST